MHLLSIVSVTQLRGVPAPRCKCLNLGTTEGKRKREGSGDGVGRQEADSWGAGGVTWGCPCPGRVLPTHTPRALALQIQNKIRLGSSHLACYLLGTVMSSTF